MGAAEKPDNDNEEQLVGIPLSDFRRLLNLMERLCQNQERTLNQRQDAARRAAQKAGPTTPEAEARVAAKLRKWGK